MKTKFDEWLSSMDAKTDWDQITPTEAMEKAWNAAVSASAGVCLAYGCSMVSPQTKLVSHACERKILALAVKEGVFR